MSTIKCAYILVSPSERSDYCTYSLMRLTFLNASVFNYNRANNKREYNKLTAENMILKFRYER